MSIKILNTVNSLNSDCQSKHLTKIIVTVFSQRSFGKRVLLSKRISRKALTHSRGLRPHGLIISQSAPPPTHQIPSRCSLPVCGYSEKWAICNWEGGPHWNPTMLAGPLIP